MGLIKRQHAFSPQMRRRDSSPQLVRVVGEIVNYFYFIVNANAGKTAGDALKFIKRLGAGIQIYAHLQGGGHGSYGVAHIVQPRHLQAEGLALNGKVGPEPIYFNFGGVYISQGKPEGMALHSQGPQVFFFGVGNGRFTMGNKFLKIPLQYRNLFVVFLQIEANAQVRPVFNDGTIAFIGLNN